MFSLFIVNIDQRNTTVFLNFAIKLLKPHQVYKFIRIIQKQYYFSFFKAERIIPIIGGWIKAIIALCGSIEKKPMLSNIDAAQIQNQDSQIPNYFVHPKCTNPKLFCASQMHKSQIICASQITYGIPNYLWHPKLFVIPNYDTLNP